MTPVAHLWSTSLADVFLSGEWSSEGLRSRGRTLWGRHRPLRWFAPLVERLLRVFPDPPLGRRHGLLAWIGEQPAVLLWLRRRTVTTLVLSPLAPFGSGPERWGVPDLPTRGDLARWLGIDPWGLDWLADRRNLLDVRAEAALHHYRWRWIPKSSGGLRLLETPKPTLAGIQRRILHGLLDRIPPHDAAHGFVTGRSVLTYAAPHVGQQVLIGMDLREFFPSTTRTRVQRIFAAAGYTERVASTLAALCTACTPRHVRDEAPAGEDRWWSVRRLAGPHLPQGAPTSRFPVGTCWPSGPGGSSGSSSGSSATRGTVRTPARRASRGRAGARSSAAWS